MATLKSFGFMLFIDVLRTVLESGIKDWATMIDNAVDILAITSCDISIFPPTCMPQFIPVFLAHSPANSNVLGTDSMLG